MEVEYCWFKCSKKDSFHREPTHHLGNRIIIPVCRDDSNGYYFCEAIALEQGSTVHKISSTVAHVKVVNSTDISITRDPPPEVFITFGEELTLECKASCGHHTVRYQWFNNAKPLAGATQSTLIIPSVCQTDVGSYHCVITSEYSETRAVSRMTQVKGKSHCHACQ